MTAQTDTTGNGPAPAGITSAAPLPSRLLAWIGERHGPVLLIPVLLLFGISFLSGFVTPLSDPSMGIMVAPATIALGAVAAWLWFLALRIFDDLGDREADAVAHPDRLLQLGVVSPGELRAVALVAGVIMLGTCLEADGGIGPITFTWLAAVAGTALAGTESFAPKALRDRPMLHRLVRVPCSSLPVLWWFQLGAAGTGLKWPAAVLALVAVLVVVVFDVARKLEPATAPGQTSWSDTLGEARAHAVLAGVLAALGAACAGLLAATEVASAAPLAILAVAVALFGTAIARGKGKLAAPGLLVLLLTTLITLWAATA